MYRPVLLFMLFILLKFVGLPSTSSAQTATAGYTYYPPVKDKESWQRLNLLLSSTFIVVAREGQVDHDTCLYIASRSLGLSRFPVLAEDFGDMELLEQSQWIDRKNPGIGIRLLSKATGKKRLQLLLLLGSYYAFEPGSSFRYRDSVEYFLNKAIDESKLLKEEQLGRIALCLLGKMYVQVNDSKGDSIFNLLISQCRKAGDEATEARAIAYRGIYTAPMPATFQQKLTDLQTASDLYHNLGNTEAEINVLTDLGYMLFVIRQLEPAQETFLKALTLAQAISYPYIHYNTDAVSVVTMSRGMFGEPLRYILQTIRVAENCRDSIGWGHFYTRLAQLYNTEGREKESMDMTQTAINRFIIDRDPAVYNVLNWVIADMCSKGLAKEALNLTMSISKKVNTPVNFTDQFFYYNVLVTCYAYLKKPDMADMYVKKMDSLETKAEAIRGPLRRGTINDQLAHIFLEKGQYKKAKEYFEKHFTVTSAIERTLSSDLYTYYWLIHIDSILDDRLSAISHYKKYTNLLDSNFRVTKIRQAEELQVTYETQEKESQIASLNHQAKQTRLVKNLTLAGIAAVVIIAALLYRQSRLRRKNNKIVTQKNEQLQSLLADKEWLLKEVHHRVKNNLQVIMSLLNSQSVFIEDDAALTAINDSQRRVQAISLIHQKLYQSENASSIELFPYIEELITYLKDSFGTGNRILFDQHIGPINLDVAKAIPLGLIINEAIVNAIKYAFPGGQQGVVSISLKQDGPEYLLLNISDNGIGLPPGVEVSKQDSLGFSLMQGLTKQLDGTFAIESNNGLHISIHFIALSNHQYE